MIAFTTFLFPLVASSMEVVSFQNGKVNLKGELYLPEGSGPFPAILFNHGSAAGMLNSEASKEIAPYFVKRGWAFFMPYRRGQGLSNKSGPYVMDLINQAIQKGGMEAGSQMLVTTLKGDHLSDQLAALRWLQSQKFIKKDEVAALGNSFGGIETMLGVSQGSYCAGVNASGGAKSWSKSPSLQALMKKAARSAQAPVLFFQAKNDYSLVPSEVLSKEMTKAGKRSVVKIYPAFGKTEKEGHSFHIVPSLRGLRIFLNLLKQRALNRSIFFA